MFLFGSTNSIHPAVVHNERVRVTNAEVVTALGKRLYNIGKSMDSGEGTSGVLSKDLVCESDDEPV